MRDYDGSPIIMTHYEPLRPIITITISTKIRITVTIIITLIITVTMLIIITITITITIIITLRTSITIIITIIIRIGYSDSKPSHAMFALWS
jgi:hypothetical protein